jgi:hypothetical protein
VSVASVLLPAFVLVGLTFLLLVWMGRARFASVRTGDVKVKDIALGQRAWPARVQQIANTYQNQFELPVLFYVLVALALVTRQADLLFVAMSWLFVATRLVHAYIYVTSNAILRRFQAFLAGALVLMLMWTVFAVRILLLGGAA